MFKVGDRVRCISLKDAWIKNNSVKIGDIVTIKMLEGKAGSGFLMEGKHFWMDINCFKKINIESHLPEFL